MMRCCAKLQALPRDTKLVFHCHHGGRSQAMAERFAALGFRDVHNLAGGIDAWSAAGRPVRAALLMALQIHAPPREIVARIEDAIRAALPGCEVSASGAAGHFEIRVVSAAFAGKRTLEKQRLVYAAIAHLMQGDAAPVHAVDKLETLTP